MAEREPSLSLAKWVGPTITIIAVTNIAILLDIPVLRQIFGFIFLTFIPGFLFLSILKLNKLSLVEKIVLTVGLSISFIMFFGLLLNSLLLAIGYTEPLATVSLLISFSTATIVLVIIAYIRNKDITFSFPDLKLPTREKAFLIVPAMFPLLSIVGLRLMNLTDNNALLMLLLFLIPGYVIFISFSNRKVPERVYPIAIFLISVSLVLFYALRSNHLLGSDIHQLYYFYGATLNNLHWSLVGPELVEACLITSLLPAIYQQFLNIDPEYLFKLLHSLLFSVTPLVVYIISKKYMGSFYAFLASFFFMSQYYFPWTAGIANTAIGILFFALAIMVLFHDGISELNRRLLFIIFSASVILSHYSTSYIFLLVLILVWIGMLILPRFLYGKGAVSALSGNPATKGTPPNSPIGKTPLSYDADASQSSAHSVSQLRFKKRLTITTVVLFFILLFFWYSQITESAFSIGVGVVYKTFTNLNQWFLLESKGPTVAAASGTGINTIPQQVRFVVSWLTVAFIALGVLITMVRYKSMIAIPKLGHLKPSFLKLKFSLDFFVVAMACSAALGISVLLPYVMEVYSMERTYHQLITILAPFFVLGGILIARLLKVRPYWIILLVLVPFFMSTTGTTYQIFGHRESIILNSEGISYEYTWVHEQESCAAKWITQYGRGGSFIYTGKGQGVRVFVSQGVVHPSTVRSFIGEYKHGNAINGYIYLRNIDLAIPNVLTEYPKIFEGKNKLYTAGISEVYR